MKALVFGATGLVGNILLKKLLSDDSYTQITAVTRKPLPINHEKLNSIEGDFNSLDRIVRESQAFECDVVFCCLGTTLKKARSKEAFKLVDYDYPLKIAQLLKSKNPLAQFHIISALGADSNSRVFYNRIKGEIEDSLIDINFEKLVIYRPSLILGNRDDKRPLEQIGQLIAKFLDPFITAVVPGYAGIEASKIAEIMILKSKKDFKGNVFVESDEIKLLGL